MIHTKKCIQNEVYSVFYLNKPRLLTFAFSRSNLWARWVHEQYARRACSATTRESLLNFESWTSGERNVVHAPHQHRTARQYTVPVHVCVALCRLLLSTQWNVCNKGQVCLIVSVGSAWSFCIAVTRIRGNYYSIIYLKCIDAHIDTDG